jgi:hypothetical protein
MPFLVRLFNIFNTLANILKSCTFEPFLFSARIFITSVPANILEESHGPYCLLLLKVSHHTFRRFFPRKEIR